MVKSMAECVACKHKFEISGTNVHKQEFKDKEGNHLWITHYDCPACGRRHYVQIDSPETNGLLLDLQKRTGRAMALRRQGKQASKKQRRDYTGTQRHLTELRTELMKRYQECELVAMDGHSERMEFVI